MQARPGQGQPCHTSDIEEEEHGRAAVNAVDNRKKSHINSCTKLSGKYVSLSYNIFANLMMKTKYSTLSHMSHDGILAMSPEGILLYHFKK